MADDVRIDRWLCAVRLVKTRPIATQLCEGGHVRVNGNPAKPSTKVRAGDVVHALIAERERIVEVVRPHRNARRCAGRRHVLRRQQPTAGHPRDRTRHQGDPWAGPPKQTASPRTRTDAADRTRLTAFRGRATFALAGVYSQLLVDRRWGSSALWGNVGAPLPGHDRSSSSRTRRRRASRTSSPTASSTSSATGRRRPRSRPGATRSARWRTSSSSPT